MLEKCENSYVNLKQEHIRGVFPNFSLDVSLNKSESTAPIV